MKKIIYSAIILLSFTSGHSLAQLVPVNIAAGNFNEDIIADGTGNNPLAVTTTPIDGSSFNNVLYSREFQAANSTIITGGGLPTNGTLVSGTDSYQLQGYNSTNAIFFPANNVTSKRDLSLISTAAYSQLSIAAFSANGTGSTITVSTNYSDGSSESGGTITVPDWYSNSPYLINSLGRINRINAVSAPSGLSSNDPRIYAIPISVNSAKILNSVTITSVTTDNQTSLSILALSGVLTASLPIDLTSFKGTYQDNMKCVVLNWDAFNIAGTLKFEIERSVDGSHFTKIEEVMPFSATERRSYTFNDYTAKNTQINYYRVKQVQQTGQAVYTTVIRVEPAKAGALLLKLMQSPGMVNVQNILSQHSYDYTLLNSSAVVIRKGRLSSGDHSIDISLLSGGVYYLKLASGNDIQTLKFFK